MFNTKNIRALIQSLIMLALIVIVIVYGYYTSGALDFKILSISDMNPYGGWSALRERIVDSSYDFEGISMSIALTIALLTMAIIGGRFFCGWLCPIGAVQDFTAWAGRKLRVKQQKGLRIKGADLLVLKYPLLLLFLVSSILGYEAVISELSPWRTFLGTLSLKVTFMDMKLGFTILLIIFLASVFISRFFCRYLCPLGAAQALFSSFSLSSIKHHKGCSKCNKCLDKCPMGLSFSEEDNTISPECIRCLKCVDDCKVSPNNRVHMGFLKRNMQSKYYISLMLVLFLLIWNVASKLWGGHASRDDILLGNLRDGAYLGESRGFASKITTEVKIYDGKITEIKIIDHKESKGWYEEVFMIIPREIINKQRLNVDVISGATKSSKGLINSIENAIKKAADN